MSSHPQKNLEPHSSPSFNPAAEDMREELEKLRAEIEATATDAIKWYLERKPYDKTWSQRLRRWAIVLASLGGLMPLMTPLLMSLQPAHLSLFSQLSYVGYVLLGVAAACVGFDKFFGFSSAWMRYMTTEMSLQHELAEFQMDWLILTQKLGNSQPDAEMQLHMLERMKAFRLQVSEHLRNEMQIWVNEFHTSLAQLEKTTQVRPDIPPQPKDPKAGEAGRKKSAG